MLFIYLLAFFMGTGAMVLLEEERVDRFLIVVMAATMLLVITVLMELGRKHLSGRSDDAPKDAPSDPKADPPA